MKGSNMKCINIQRLIYMWKLVVSIFSFSISTLFVNANSSSPNDTSLLNDFLKKTVKFYNIPGLAVTIVDEERALFMSAYGTASNGTNFTINTPSLLGSTTKAFTALAIMRLVEYGRIDLDAPVKKYLPEFKLAQGNYENTITIRNLLNHTSGLSDEGMPFKSFGENSLEEELQLLKLCKPTSPPGERFLYFNDNYRILGLVIERVSGEKYAEFLNNEIFKSLRMESTTALTSGLKCLATGYGEIFGLPLKRKQKFRAGALPSGYVASSISDLSHFLIAELQANNGDTSLLNPQSVKTTWTPPENIKGGYAMGWMRFDTIGKTPFMAHGGSLENYLSFFYINPQLKKGFALIMNQGGIIPMMGGFNTIRNGLIRYIDNEAPENGRGLWPVLIITACFLVISGIEILLTYRQRKWLTRIANKKKWKIWTGFIFDLLLSCFLALWGIKSSFMLYNLLPESFFLLWLMTLLGFTRSLHRIIIITKNPNLLFTTH